MTKKTNVLIYGAGGHGRAVLDAALRVRSLRVVGMLDDDPALRGQRVLGVSILGDACRLVEPEFRSCRVVVALGAPADRQRAVARVLAAGRGFASVVHPRAFLAREVTVGEGAMILPLAVVHTGATVGFHAIVNTAAIVEHDSRVGDFAHIAPGVCLAGGVTVGACAQIGIGACVAPNVRVGDRAVVGAGAAVVEDVAPDDVVVGVPARSIGKGRS